MRRVVWLTGPINSGKTTLGRALAGRWPGAVFVDGDDHDAPDGADLAARIGAAMARIERLVLAGGERLVVAYPLDAAGYARMRAVCGAGLMVAVLAPPLAEALRDRGGRVLTAWERARIGVMYAEGFDCPGFADLVIDTAVVGVAEAVGRLVAVLGE